MRRVSVGNDLKRWCSPKHLKTQEDRRLFLEAGFEEDPGDGSLIQTCIRDICLSWGEILPDGPIEISTATRIMKTLGMELRVISPA